MSDPRYSFIHHDDGTLTLVIDRPGVASQSLVVTREFLEELARAAGVTIREYES